MKKSLPAAALSAAALLIAFACHAYPADAQEMHQHQHDSSEKLGRVSFKVLHARGAKARWLRTVGSRQMAVGSRR